ncbi:hypothetical protein GCM10009776_14740 [Microbacterium deminutum]|uniref:Uncharacterized protein n=1 Tax=Microbacterium deminutum TaxID=344164 RepID=A0ABN2QNG9_9MICO
MLPPAPTQTPGGGLPPVPDPTPLVSAPLPHSSSASGKLVAGFPKSIMGPTSKSDILSTSIATERDTMQVTLVARTDASADDVRAHYKKLWAALGLADAGATDGGVAYSDSLSSLSLAFSSAGTGTVYQLFAVFRTS